jgi:hypothetical protein
MKFMMMFWVDESAAVTADEDAAMLIAVKSWVEEMTERGVMVHGGALRSAGEAAIVQVRDGEVLVSDGPFAETKELVAGFWIWNVKSMDEAVEWVKRCPNPFPNQESDIEIRQVFEAEDFGAEFTPELREKEERVRKQADQLAKTGKH